MHLCECTLEYYQAPFAALRLYFRFSIHVYHDKLKSLQRGPFATTLEET